MDIIALRCDFPIYRFRNIIAWNSKRCGQCQEIIWGLFSQKKTTDSVVLKSIVHNQQFKGYSVYGFI
jgi:hypothetical protein